MHLTRRILLSAHPRQLLRTSNISFKKQTPPFIRNFSTIETKTAASSNVPSAEVEQDWSVPFEVPVNLDESVKEVLNATISTAAGIDPPLNTLGYTPSALVVRFISLVHETTGLPWWATISMITLAFRLSIFPTVIRSQRESYKLQQAKPIIEQIQRDTANDPGVNEVVRARMIQDVYKKYDIKFSRIFVPVLLQLPVLISFFLGLRYGAQILPSFHTGGALWFPDLTIPDVYRVLPFVTSGMFLLQVELGGESGTEQTKNLKNIFRFMALMSIPLTMQVESAVFMYWITTSTFSLVQITSMKNPQIRKLFGLPPLTRPLLPSQQVALQQQQPQSPVVSSESIHIPPQSPSASHPAPAKATTPLPSASEPISFSEERIKEEIRNRRNRNRQTRK